MQFQPQLTVARRWEPRREPPRLLCTDSCSRQPQQKNKQQLRARRTACGYTQHHAHRTAAGSRAHQHTASAASGVADRVAQTTTDSRVQRRSRARSAKQLDSHPTAASWDRSRKLRQDPRTTVAVVAGADRQQPDAERQNTRHNRWERWMRPSMVVAAVAASAHSTSVFADGCTLVKGP